MQEKLGVLVVGGDSLVGGATVRALIARGHRTVATTRHRERLGKSRVFLDFENSARFLTPEGLSCALVIAAATNYDRCETDPAARVINEEHIPRLVADLLEQGLFVTFISTNSVFGGERPWPHEDDPHAPGIAYAWQKSVGEQVIREKAAALSATDRLSITRLTKVVGPDTSPFPAWLSAWLRQEVVEPFSDLIFAPISLAFVADALATIAEKRVPGHLHVSGKDNVSYAELAYHICRRLGIDERLVAPTTAVEKGVHIAFKPNYSGLGMSRTTALTGLEPQTLDSVIDDVFAAQLPDFSKRRA